MSRKIQDISATRLRELHQGAEARDLVEWLAMDQGELLRFLSKEHKLAVPSAGLLKEVRELTITQRVRKIAEHLHQLGGASLRTKLQDHPSDSVRIWASLMLALEAHPLKERLDLTRMFAADSHMGVREYAWMSFRPFLVEKLSQGLKLLEPFATDSDSNLRRFASEVSRPRGVWTTAIAALRKDPAQALPLLEHLKSDPEKYVQTSVGNWLNDASKDQAAWVQSVCARWAQIDSPNTRWIIKHGLRTLNKS
jgi:3-methyladenine DNA glycosylase AlkC